MFLPVSSSCDVRNESELADLSAGDGFVRSETEPGTL